MLLSLRHFLKPEDILFIEIMLFRGDVINCNLFYFKDIFFISLKFKLCRLASPSRNF